MVRIGICALVAVVFSSCVSTEKFNAIRIPADQVVYEQVKQASQQGATIKYFLIKKVLEQPIYAQAETTDPDKPFKITKVLGNAEFSKADTIENLKSKVFDNDVLYVFPKNYEFKDKAIKLKEYKSIDYIVGGKFIYKTSKSVFQAVSIPFKIRPKKESTPYQVSTGVNIGFAYGIQNTRHTYKKTYHYTGNKANDPSMKDLSPIHQRTSSVSFTYAPVLGLTTVSLTKENTNDTVAEDRTVLGANVGALALLGINQLNLGLAVGIDYGFGSKAKEWIYQGDPWLGIVVALDFIK
jgi:hypothetical protein